VIAYVLFSTTDSVFSKAICQATRSPASHTAILYNNMVWESKFLRGVRCTPFSDWAKINRIISAEPWPESAKPFNPDDLLVYSNSWYDVGALLFLSVCYLLGTTPKSNLWNHPQAKMCTEYVYSVIFGEGNALVTPWELRGMVQHLNNPS
jgi:hypothetical protein